MKGTHHSSERPQTARAESGTGGNGRFGERDRFGMALGEQLAMTRGEFNDKVELTIAELLLDDVENLID